MQHIYLQHLRSIQLVVGWSYFPSCRQLARMPAAMPTAGCHCYPIWQQPRRAGPTPDKDGRALAAGTLPRPGEARQGKASAPRVHAQGHTGTSVALRSRTHGTRIKLLAARAAGTIEGPSRLHDWGPGFAARRVPSGSGCHVGVRVQLSQAEAAATAIAVSALLPVEWRLRALFLAATGFRGASIGLHPSRSRTRTTTPPAGRLPFRWIHRGQGN